MLNIETNTIVNRCILCWCWALSLNQRKYKMLNIETNKIVNICTLCRCRAFSCLQKLTKRIQIGSTTFFLVAARNVSEAGQSVQLDITETSKSDSHQRPITSDPFVGISAKYWRDITDVSPCHTCAAALKTEHILGQAGTFFPSLTSTRSPKAGHQHHGSVLMVWVFVFSYNYAQGCKVSSTMSHFPPMVTENADWGHTFTSIFQAKVTIWDFS